MDAMQVFLVPLKKVLKDDVTGELFGIVAEDALQAAVKAKPAATRKRPPAKKPPAKKPAIHWTQKPENKAKLMRVVKQATSASIAKRKKA